MRRVIAHDGKQWSNAAADRVALVDSDPSWSSQYEEEAAALLTVLPAGAGVRLEHFGSTAISGIRAKPIIDILVIHPEPADWPQLIDPITSLRYVYWSQNPRKDRMFFVKGMPPFGSGRSHHVHVRVPQDAVAELSFRDLLRGNSALTRRYALLKDSLASRYPNDRDAYTDGKTEFVAEVLRQNAV